jgi:DNA polymerase-4
VRTILHVDMDAFFASVEQLDDETLRGKPVVVGARSPRGVVAAASYEARPFGVRSAMPMMEALRRCPHAVVVPPRIARYAEVSGRVFAIFRRYTPLVEGLSFDEAFLDVTGSQALFGSGAAIAERIRGEIRSEVGLTASAGVAPSKFVAKIASDVHKPDGLMVVAPGEVLGFLRPLPVERMWGVGPKAAERLRVSGLRTIGALADADEATLTRLLGRAGGGIHALARGLDDRPVVADSKAKSIGAEETFERDLRTKEELLRPLLAQSARVAARLMTSGRWASVVTLKLKNREHAVHTRRLVLPRPVADTDAIFDAAKQLLDRFPAIGEGVRLSGVSASELRESPPEATLFPDAMHQKRERVEKVTAELRARFGAKGLSRARLLGQGSGGAGEDEDG